MEEEKVTIEMTPFEALGILTLLRMFGDKVKKVAVAEKLINGYDEKIDKAMTTKQVEDAYAELQVLLLIDPLNNG